MTLCVHLLGGCGPTPLAYYLKAIGIHRLVALQAEPDARSDWSGDRFRLITRLDRAALLDFFLRKYVPTPIVAPWNGGSGFYPKDNREGIDRIRSGNAARFAPYRDAIERGRAAVGRRQKRAEGDEKRKLVLQLRRDATGDELAWISAAIAPVGDDLEYPALLGTGGNDGRLDFTNNQMQRLTELFDVSSGEPMRGVGPLLEQALFGVPVPGLLADRAIGQFLPGGAGGANATAGFEGTSLINPWDFILMFEGAILFRVAAVRRLESETAQAAAPFAIRAQAAGYASAAMADESARGEQWMPLWEQPASLSEIEAMFAEGRLQVNTRPARQAVEASLAVARLGISRGITAFERYGYIERNGQANLAVPLGRWRVPTAPVDDLKLLDPVMPWLDELRSRVSRSRTTPAIFERLIRRLEADVLAVCQRPGDRGRWQSLTIDLGRAEAEMVRRPKRTAELGLNPIPPLPVEWLAVCNDDTPEVRIAAAIASQRDPRSGADNLGSIRRHMAPLDDPDSQHPRFERHGSRAPSLVWAGRDLTSDLGTLVMRRVVEAQMNGAASFPLDGRVVASLEDIAAFLLGGIDEELVAGLARGLTAIRWGRRARLSQVHGDGERYLPVAYSIFRLLFVPALPRNHKLEPLVGLPDPRPLRLLMANQPAAAFAAVIRRLSIRGLRLKFHQVICDRELARRVLASLAIPISYSSFDSLRYYISKPISEARPHEATAE